MRRLLGAIVCVGLLTGCGLLPIGGEGGAGWPFPNTDLGSHADGGVPDHGPARVRRHGAGAQG